MFSISTSKIIFSNILRYIQSHFFPISAFILIAIFYLTSHSYEYLFAIDHGFSDVASYVNLAMSDDFNSLRSLSAHYPWHHLERWVPHLIIGLLIKIYPIDIWSIYKTINFLCICMAAYLIGTLKCKSINKAAYFSLLLFNPYTFRYYAGVPGMLNDAIFFVALIAFCVAIFNKKVALLCVATLLACLTRQTGVLLLPILALSYYHDKSTLSVLFKASLSAITGLMVAKIGGNILFEPTSKGYLIDHTLGIFFWLADNPNLYDLINFFGRYILMLLSISPLLILLKNQRVDTLGIYGLIFFLLIQSQPILGGPGITGLNIDRLAILGLPFLGFLFFRAGISIRTFFIFEFVMLISSFNPFFSSLHLLAPYNRYLFVSLIVCIFCFCIIFFSVNNIHILKLKNLLGGPKL
jgi:hypothetical protein